MLSYSNIFYVYIILMCFFIVKQDFDFLLHFTASYKRKRYLPQYENNIAMIDTDITDEYIRLFSIDIEFIFVI